MEIKTVLTLEKNNTEILNVVQLSALLQCSKTFARSLCRSDRVGAVLIAGRYLIQRKDVFAWLNSKKKTGASQEPENE